MTKFKNKMNSNFFVGILALTGFLLMWGCSKNVAPPEVEEPPAPVVETLPMETEEDLPPEEPEQVVIEEPQETDIGGFQDVPVEPEEPVVEEVVEVPVEEPVIEEVVEVPVEEPMIEEPMVEEPMVEEPVVEEVVEAPMEEEPVFVAPEPEPEPVQEARMLPFEEERQLEDVHFDYDRDMLDDKSKEILQGNAQWLKNNPNARVEIQGHADERGTNNYNLGLGQRRAMQTKKYLISLGIDESRLYTISYGEEKPFCFESNENCWWENRRAHFMVAD